MSSSPSGLLNMRVTANSSQGHRKYMEDCYKIRFQRDMTTATTTTRSGPDDIDTNNNSPPHSDIIFSYFGIFDGHGGDQASQYCKQHLYWAIIRQDGFWSSDDAAILDAIKKGFVQCHDDMWSQLPNWPRTNSGLPSTSGTTATVVFIKGCRVYVGHVGDSGLVVGMRSRRRNVLDSWDGKKMTRDHKPDDPIELKRILEAGGDVQVKSGVNRVVWNRPLFNRFQQNNFKSQSGLSTRGSHNDQPESDVISHYNTDARNSTTPYELNYLRNQPNTPTERIPFLAVARSLGDLWSYSSTHDDYVVSPVPDTFCFDLDPAHHKCLILATDGLWNVISVNECVELVRHTDTETQEIAKRGGGSVKRSKSSSDSTIAPQPFVNPSQRLVQTAIQRCCEKMIRADNTTCITIMLDSPYDSLDETISEKSLHHHPLRNLQAIPRNKTFEHYSRIGENDDENPYSADLSPPDLYDEADDGFMGGEFDMTTSNNRSRCQGSRGGANSRTTLPTSSTMRLDSIDPPPDELATPMFSNEDKRSRSLTSLRRRHWSASSNRSSTVISTASHYKPPPPVEVREKTNRSRHHAVHDTYTKFSSSQARPVSLKANSTMMNPSSHYKHQNESRTATNSRHYMSNINLSSSVCSFVSSGGKKLRKSVNGLLNVTTRREEESSKENKLAKPQPASSTEVKTNGYANRLKRFKSTLIKTKNTLFNRKGGKKPTDSEFDQSRSDLKRKSSSSPNLAAKLNRTAVEIPTNSSRYELDGNQSMGGREQLIHQAILFEYDEQNRRL